MSALPVIGFALLALAAILFAGFPLLRRKYRAPGKGRWLLAGAVVVFVLGVGTGTYLMLGRPHLALRTAMGLKTNEVNGLVPFLIERVRQYPGDARAWRYLGELYMAARAPGEAAQAYAKAVAITGKGDGELDAALGEALVMSDGGAVSDQAMAAFQAALAAKPGDVPSRFYLGLGKAQRNDRAGAITLWQQLLTEVPESAPLHQMLLDRIAMMTAAGIGGGGGARDPRAMVARLAARLKEDPKDAPGWVRLVRAYHVLGDDAKARAALAEGRKAFAGDKAVQAAFDTAEKDLK